MGRVKEPTKGCSGRKQADDTRGEKRALEECAPGRVVPWYDTPTAASAEIQGECGIMMPGISLLPTSAILTSSNWPIQLEAREPGSLGDIVNTTAHPKGEQRTDLERGIKGITISVILPITQQGR